MYRLHRQPRSLAFISIAIVSLVGCVSTQDETSVSTQEAALSVAQCDYFSVNGKVRICHATGSAKNPYTVLQVSENACVNSHTQHAGDYVAINDPTCGGQGFLPPGAPCDPTLPCSLGYTCRAAVCQPTDLCLGVTCSASDQCHVAHCDPGTGLCVDEAKVDGFACDDGDTCTQTDTCHAGTCIGDDPVTCTASDACHMAGVCDPASGLCSNPAAADGTACNDDDACTQSDTCQVGACTGSDPLTCAASDACHGAGVCDPASGLCSNPVAADGTACNDEDACTQSDTCQAGACTGSNPVTCDGSPVNLVVNGSFEDGVFAPVSSNAWVEVGTQRAVGAYAITGWTVVGLANWVNSTDMGPHFHGNKAFDIEHAGFCHGPGRATLSQTIATTAGTRYRLSFHLAAPYNGDPCSGLAVRHLRAAAAGVATTFAIDASPHRAMVWEERELVFTATSSSTELVFTSPDGDANGYYSAFLDAVSVVVFDDGCTSAGTCSPDTGTCTSTVLADGTACDDGDPLTANDTCSAGTCTGVSPAACPCFDASQIETAWEAVQEVKALGGVTDGNEPYQWCQDKTLTYGDGAVQTHTQMQFFEFSGRTGGTCGYWDEYTSRDGNFVGLTFAAGPTGTATCQAGLGGGTYSCGGGGYTAAPTNYSTFISTPADAITPAQANACKDLIHAFAANKGIPCVPVFVP